jgi:hypothetical protein
MIPFKFTIKGFTTMMIAHPPYAGADAVGAGYY